MERLKFSLKHKIKYNVFDDDLSFLNFHSDGWPPIPSISMLKEIKQNLINKNEVQWMFKHKLGKMWLDNFKNDSTINLVKDHYIFPDLFSPNLFSPKVCFSRVYFPRMYFSRLFSPNMFSPNLFSEKRQNNPKQP